MFNQTAAFCSAFKHVRNSFEANSDGQGGALYWVLHIAAFRLQLSFKKVRLWVLAHVRSFRGQSQQRVLSVG